MGISFTELRASIEARTVIICSLEQALYQVLVVIDGVETLLREDNGRPYRSHNLQLVREALQNMPIASMVLRQQSAYDEMIGQPPREQDNCLEVHLSLDLDLPPLH